MTEIQKLLIELAEQEPCTRIAAPLMRLILDSAGRSFSKFHSLMELWSKLKGDERAALVMMLDSTLSVEAVARLAGVNRRTLYKSPLFRKVRTHIRATATGSPPRGISEDADFESESDDWNGE